MPVVFCRANIERHMYSRTAHSSVSTPSCLCPAAQRYGDGSLRLTVEQNILFPNIPEDRLDEMRQEAIFKVHEIEAGPLSRGLVSCTGSQFCGIALIETKNRCPTPKFRPRGPLAPTCMSGRQHSKQPQCLDSFDGTLCMLDARPQLGDQCSGATQSALALAYLDRSYQDQPLKCARWIGHHQPSRVVA